MEKIYKDFVDLKKRASIEDEYHKKDADIEDKITEIDEKIKKIKKQIEFEKERSMQIIEEIINSYTNLEIKVDNLSEAWNSRKYDSIKRELDILLEERRSAQALYDKYNTESNKTVYRINAELGRLKAWLSDWSNNIINKAHERLEAIEQSFISKWNSIIDGYNIAKNKIYEAGIDHLKLKEAVEFLEKIYKDFVDLKKRASIEDEYHKKDADIEDKITEIDEKIKKIKKQIEFEKERSMQIIEEIINSYTNLEIKVDNLSEAWNSRKYDSIKRELDILLEERRSAQALYDKYNTESNKTVYRINAELGRLKAWLSDWSNNIINKAHERLEAIEQSFISKWNSIIDGYNIAKNKIYEAGIDHLKLKEAVEFLEKIYKDFVDLKKRASIEDEYHKKDADIEGKIAEIDGWIQAIKNLI
ncbi:hypothetical protein DMC14_03275 [Metamycoplasma phocicerebrale]|uniref:Uncharacterized protein n=1 Tax=Metamycoplasma phocicerebrale TaxID=142649 RepID=A0A482KF07_9BACT|nr:hypothetical protein [Metamycoplasma phocicerebrale]QBQ01830.1 hypothetical protein DMC14_03275 [Metamycoplasma phocicerebrale]